MSLARPRTGDSVLIDRPFGGIIEGEVFNVTENGYEILPVNDDEIVEVGIHRIVSKD